MSGLGIAGMGRRVRVYIGEADRWQAKSLFLAILESLRAEGCAGATVLRGIAGFGANSRIHTATILRLSEDLPIVIEWIDTPERVERVLPKIRAMVESGLITLEDVQIVHYQHRPVADIASRVRVRELMTRDVTTVSPDTPLREAIGLLLNKDLRALPVVDSGRKVVGIVTNGDLVERGGLRLRMEMLGALTPGAIAEELESLGQGRTVSDVMTGGVLTISSEASLADAAHTMVDRQVKRLPVVNQSGDLVGMISRVDLLRSGSEGFPRSEDTAPLREGATIGDIVRTDVATVRRDAVLAEVLDAVISTRLNQVIVLDKGGRVIGGISDAELTRRLSPRNRPGLVRALMGRLPFASLPEEERRELERSSGSTAEQLMYRDLPAVAANTPVAEAITIMLRGRRKILPVVDASGRFLGAVDRADLLRMLASGGKG